MSDHPFRTLVEMARAAQHDDRQSTGALYGKLADRIEQLEAALRWYAKDYDFDKGLSQWDGGAKARAALAPEQEK